MTYIGSAQWWEEACMEARTERDALAARLAEAERLLRRAVNQSARVHPDFMGEIQDWLKDSDIACPHCPAADDDCGPHHAPACPFFLRAADSASQTSIVHCSCGKAIPSDRYENHILTHGEGHYARAAADSAPACRCDEFPNEGPCVQDAAGTFHLSACPVFAWLIRDGFKPRTDSAPAVPKCNPGVVCTHDGNCNDNCGGDHYWHDGGYCLRCGEVRAFMRVTETADNSPCSDSSG